MEIVDELKGMLKATGAQIKSRLKVGEATEAPVVEALEEKVAEADKTSVSEIVQNTSSTECVANPTNQVIDRVFQLRENFVIIGLTGRTGSGCTTVAGKLTTAEWKELKTNYKDFNSDQIDNVVRKNRIVHRYLKEHWTQAFDVISASDIIFYYALKESFDDFANSLASVNIEPDEESKYEKSKPIIDTALREELNKLQDEFNALHDKVMECEEYLHEPDYNNTEKLELVRSVVLQTSRHSEKVLREF
jgi:hypothetical protein